MRGDGRPFSIPSAFGRVLNSEHPTAHPPTRPFFAANVVNERRATQGSLKDMSMDASSCLLQRFDDLQRCGRTVRSKPLHNPICLLAVGFPLVAPTGRTRHDESMATGHIKSCLGNFELRVQRGMERGVQADLPASNISRRLPS